MSNLAHTAVANPRNVIAVRLTGKFVLPSVVYIVDDNVSFHTSTGRQLKLAGYEVQIYSSAEHFLDQQRDDSRLGCLLVDVRIPRLGGLELQARLH
jgi:FixJ family two-component response regulator